MDRKNFFNWLDKNLNLSGDELFDKEKIYDNYYESAVTEIEETGSYELKANDSKSGTPVIYRA